MRSYVQLALIVVLMVFLSGSSSAQGQQNSVRQALNVGFVVSLPPYVMGESGILVDLVREALRRSGISMNIYHFPSRQFDGNPLTLFEDLDFFVGTPAQLRNDNSYYKIFEFDNVAVSKSSAQLSVNSIDDLLHKQIVAFNNAGIHLKEPFTSFYKENLKGWSGYIEVENQKSQFAMLMNDRTQLILLDRYMVYYYASEYGLKDMNELVFHEIFPVNNEIYAVARDESIIGHLKENLPGMIKEGWMEKMLTIYRNPR